MNADELLVDEVEVVTESRARARIAEGHGPQGAWVAWSSLCPKCVRLIAVDDEAFYALSATLTFAAELKRHLRDGAPPSVLFGQGRTIPLDKITAIHVESKSGQIAISYLKLTGMAAWDEKGYPVTVLRELLDELAKRFEGAKRWHRTYTPLRASLFPLIWFLLTGGTTFLCWGMLEGRWGGISGGYSWKSRIGRELAAAVGPTGVLLIGAAVMVGQCVWMARRVRNPPIMEGIKPKGTLWKKGKKKIAE